MEEKQKYVVLLRGINVGGHHKVPMAELRELLEDMGYAEVKTLLNSGNIVLESKQTAAEVIEEEIAAKLEHTFGFPVPVLVRESKTIKEILSSDPFGEVEPNKDIRQYVTFLKQSPDGKVAFDFPQTFSNGSFKIISSTKMEIFSILDVSQGRTTQAMSILKKTFDQNITTRNWNTILKIGKLL